MKKEHLIAAREAASAYPAGFSLKWSAALNGSCGCNNTLRAEMLVKRGTHVP